VKHEPKVAVIVVCYDSLKDLPDLCDSLDALLYKNIQPFFVINSPEDGSYEYLHKRKYAHVLKTGANLGYAGGNNYGANAVLEDGSYDYLFFLNPDTVIDENCIANLISHAGHNTILQPSILLHKDGKKTNIINTVGNPLHYLGFSYAGGNGQDFQATSDVREITIASGAAFFISVENWKTIGGFTEDFFMYHEDVDLSWKAQMAGFDILHVSKATVWHKYHFSKSKRKFYYVERNRLLFILMRFEVHTLVFTLPMHIFSELLSVVLSISQGWFGQKLKAWKGVFEMRSVIHAQRSFSATLRTRSDKQLVAKLSDKLRFSEVEGVGVVLFNAFSSLYWSLIKRII
jgi:GT2 family glycosyltransferase